MIHPDSTSWNGQTTPRPIAQVMRVLGRVGTSIAAEKDKMARTEVGDVMTFYPHGIDKPELRDFKTQRRMTIAVLRANEKSLNAELKAAIKRYG